ncbi:GNAT family N-acetyltransferase [Flavobacterium sp. IMCC34852]|uniref:GNAT family N-acetyltransferase n=1 Tax=Flavobacterium rivulicola TaxID=2732161 RepID=A0A7Y3R8V5_9FLAO|nr:GNAT family N-acetyltransferase [Flavobacterium sp. IMCC34852]NNT72058.1 GNAT family N-acetyltransferase [Flavobacterium sp. IMCC34852]
MQIREIQKEDNQSIAAVIREVFISDNFPKTGTAFADVQLDFMFEAYDQPRATYFVVEMDGKIVGGAGVSQLENSTENICELQKMYFLQEARGKGIGLELIQKCMDKAIAFGYEKCYLETLPEMLAAQSLYKKMGFEYLCAPLGNTGHTTCPVWMIKSLNSK